MRYTLQHITTYAYSNPVLLSPHTLRLRPRCDVTQQLRSFALAIDPTPSRQSDVLDLDGNSVVRLWFDQAIEALTVTATAEVETFRTNAFDFLLESWAMQLPIDYPASLLAQLQPYLSGYWGGIDPTALTLAQEILQAVSGNSIAFLTELNQRIYKTCGYTLRETGEPLPPGVTWRQQSGSCRDFAVLFIEVCRAIGLAARFVSGYQEGDPDRDDRDLHAWAEVYLPGAGWRGYDPTQGLAVSDRHIALYASALARQTTPISGTLKTSGAQSQMSYALRIRAIE